MAVEYADPHPDVSDELRDELLQQADEDESQKPWDIVHAVAEEQEFREEDIRKALKRLTLEGELRFSSTGEVRASSGSV
jgi:hypothetical protein